MNIVDLGEVPARSLGMPLADFVLAQHLPRRRYRRRGRRTSPRTPARPTGGEIGPPAGGLER